MANRVSAHSHPYASIRAIVTSSAIGGCDRSVGRQVVRGVTANALIIPDSSAHQGSCALQHALGGLLPCRSDGFAQLLRSLPRGIRSQGHILRFDGRTHSCPSPSCRMACWAGFSTFVFFCTTATSRSVGGTSRVDTSIDKLLHVIGPPWAVRDLNHFHFFITVQLTGRCW